MVKITVAKDSSCDMAIVLIDGVCVMEGNTWDFHPGYHGITKYGDFKGATNLAININKHLNGQGIESEIVNKSYNYEVKEKLHQMIHKLNNLLSPIKVFVDINNDENIDLNDAKIKELFEKCKTDAKEYMDKTVEFLHSDYKDLVYW